MVSGSGPKSSSLANSGIIFESNRRMPDVGSSMRFRVVTKIIAVMSAEPAMRAEKGFLQSAKREPTTTFAPVSSATSTMSSM